MLFYMYICVFYVVLYVYICVFYMYVCVLYVCVCFMLFYIYVCVLCILSVTFFNVFMLLVSVLFHLIADTHGFADQQKLGVLLTDCIQIPNNLSEGAAFGGGDLAPSVRSCFEQVGCIPSTFVALLMLDYLHIVHTYIYM